MSCGRILNGGEHLPMSCPRQIQLCFATIKVAGYLKCCEFCEGAVLPLATAGLVLKGWPL